GRVSGIVHQNSIGQTLASYFYSYSPPPGRQPNGRLSSETDNGVTINYAYDDAGQLLSDGTNSYAYDPAGNRLAYLTGPANRLLSDGVWNYSYDFEGNVIQKTAVDGSQTWLYAYNLDNQMTSAAQYAGNGTLLGTVNYAYDVFGNR